MTTLIKSDLSQTIKIDSGDAEKDAKKVKVLTKLGIWRIYNGAMEVSAEQGSAMIEKERKELIAAQEKFAEEKAAFELQKSLLRNDTKNEPIEEETEVIEEAKKIGRPKK